MPALFRPWNRGVERTESLLCGRRLRLLRIGAARFGLLCACDQCRLRRAFFLRAAAEERKHADAEKNTQQSFHVEYFLSMQKQHVYCRVLIVRQGKSRTGMGERMRSSGTGSCRGVGEDVVFRAPNRSSYYTLKLDFGFAFRPLCAHLAAARGRKVITIYAAGAMRTRKRRCNSVK